MLRLPFWTWRLCEIFLLIELKSNLIQLCERKLFVPRARPYFNILRLNEQSALSLRAFTSTFTFYIENSSLWQIHLISFPPKCVWLSLLIIVSPYCQISLSWGLVGLQENILGRVVEWLQRAHQAPSSKTMHVDRGTHNEYNHEWDKPGDQVLCLLFISANSLKKPCFPSLFKKWGYQTYSNQGKCR